MIGDTFSVHEAWDRCRTVKTLFEETVVKHELLQSRRDLATEILDVRRSLDALTTKIGSI